MSYQSINTFYPKESFNNRSRTEQRWKDSEGVYGWDGFNQWRISLGNGKRLNRKWNKCKGFAIVMDSRGIEHSIYSERHDKELMESRKVHQPFY